MWNYEKRLQHPVNIKEPNAKLAQIIMSQYGGPDSSNLWYIKILFFLIFPPFLAFLKFGLWYYPGAFLGFFWFRVHLYKTIIFYTFKTLFLPLYCARIQPRVSFMYTPLPPICSSHRHLSTVPFRINASPEPPRLKYFLLLTGIVSY